MFTKERLKVAAFVLGAAALFFAFADFSPEEKKVFVGLWHDGYNKPAPEWTLPSLGGGEISLADYRGQIVVLNIWATWCAPCIEEMPALVRAQERFRDSGVQFVGLSIDEGGFDAVQPFVDRFNITYPIVLDDGVAADSYEGNTGVPTTYLINRKGQIWQYMPGVLDMGELVEAIETMIRAEPA